MSRIARVFPRRTRATPIDSRAFYGEPGLFPPEVDEVHVSVAFTYDRYRADALAKAWEPVAPVKLGGPGVGMPGGDFTPGVYLKPGYVITSRGCPNHCWFCSVPNREGALRELPITEGWNVLDDNLLACSLDHFCRVIEMLARQQHRAEFTGGLEARRLTRRHVEKLAGLRQKPALFFAYDDESAYEPLVDAMTMLLEAGFIRESHRVRCYVLIGYPGDTFEAAETRLRRCLTLGFTPMAMSYRDDLGRTSCFHFPAGRWMRPARIYGSLGGKPDWPEELRVGQLPEQKGGIEHE